MSGTDLATTALMLGWFALAGGAYGVLFALGELKHGTAREPGAGAASGAADSRLPFRRSSYAFYALQLVSVAAICAVTPLTFMWKLFIVASGAAYGAMPPLAWHLVERLHRA